MRNFLLLFAAVLLATRANAQSNAPVRLALIAETGEASIASDLLTVEFSKNPQVQVLERNDIEKVYREQGLSAVNRDYLKLGQVLGADGVLLITKLENQNSAPAISFGRNPPSRLNLKVQLVAVKPGVLLASESFRGIDDVSQWASGLATHLSPLIPKLSVLKQDAIPISIVNLRSAIQSPETKEVERQLTALAIERLSREHQLFVLERSKMQLLIAEKELKGLNDSAFWNGSYLLEGTLDRHGYSPNKITISARLVPPKDGTPVPIEVSGNRANFPATINQLAEKIRGSLKIAAVAAPWNPVDEAQKYFEEAQWALKWGLLEQAQNASDSAWALGKQDQDCALTRLNAYARSIPEVDPESIRHINLNGTVAYISVTNRPDPAEVDQALLVLRIYEQFGRTLPPDAPQQDSPYYISGLTVLHKATGVLRHFYFHPEAQAEVSEKLADLRAAVRSVAAWIGHSPSVRKTYWVGNHVPNRDELHNDFDDDPGTYRRLDLVRNLYQMELQSGRFWQDTPEDCLALYRSLMESPLFVCIHNDLWFMSEGNSRLATWNVGEQKRLPAVWDGFIAELNGSTNAFLSMEAKIYEFVEAKNRRLNPDFHGLKINDLNAFYAQRETQAGIAWTNLFDFVFGHYDQIVTGREQLLFIGLGMGDLFPAGEVVPAFEKLKQEFRTVISPRLGALHDDYSKRFGDRLNEMQGLPTFKDRKDYLAALGPYDHGALYRLFANQSYSKEQAAELKPLFEAYRSNLVARATNSSAKFFANANSSNIKSSYEDRLDEILNPPAPQTAAQKPPAPPPVSSTVAPKSPTPRSGGTPTSPLIAKIFLGFPTNQLPASNIESVVVFHHRMRDDNLLLDLRYMDRWGYVTNSPYQVFVYREAAAILHPHGDWAMTAFPHYGDSTTGMSDFFRGTFDTGTSQSYLEIFDNDLYVSDEDAIRRYDAKRKQWGELPFPRQDRPQLYAVEKHLYAASPEGIWEILDNGQSAKILASVRRRPTASSLDLRDNLGRPVLFSGKDHSLCVALDGEVLSWDGKDWKPVLKIEGAHDLQIFQGTAFFKAGKTPQSMELWRFSPDDAQPALCLRDVEKQMPEPYHASGTMPQSTASTPAPLWQSPKGAEFVRGPITFDGSTIYSLAIPQETNRTRTSAMKDPRLEPTLVCLIPESRVALTIPIVLDTNSGPATVPRQPLRGIVAWIECSSKYLFIGASNLRGVWALPKTEIQAEIKRQLQSRSTKNPDVQEESAEDRQKAVLEKYDRNRNGQFDAEETKAAISDPAFLEFEIAKIDLNGNGQLDAEELGYFKPNNNRALDPQEQAGIYALQHILAVKALKEFDLDGNGRLEPQEFENFARNKGPSDIALRTMQTLPANSEVERLEHYLERATEDSVQDGLTRLIPAWRSHGFDGRETRPGILKVEIETYWGRLEVEKNSRAAEADSKK